MTDDELKALCESNARAIAANSEQIASNDRATTAKINNLADVVQAFIAKLDSDGLKVTLITDVVDDVAAETSETEKTVNNHSAAITALRQDAIADRQEFRAQAEADRATFREEMAAARAQADADRAALRNYISEEMASARTQADADRAALREEMAVARTQADADRTEWQSNFNAQMEAMRSQLVEMSRINRRLDNLEQAS